MSAAGSPLLRALKLALFQFVIATFGVVFVSRFFWHVEWQALYAKYLTDWTNLTVMLLATLDGLVCGLLPAPRPDTTHSLSYRRLVRFSVPAFYILFLAVCGLCRKLSFCVIKHPVVQMIGLALICAGLLLRYFARRPIPGQDSQQGDPIGPYKFVRYPDNSGQLLELAGVPLLFGAWMPLLALPGVAVLIMWHIKDRETERASDAGGNEPKETQNRSWNLVPFIY